MNVQQPIRIKLSEFQFQCDLNYLRLRKLLACGEQRHLCLSLGPTNKSQGMYLGIRIVKNSRYTSELDIHLRLMEIPQHQHARFVVHVYQDVRSAEIVSYQNRALDGLREKYRLNQFLGKWLSRYLMDGQKINLPQVHKWA